MATRTEILAARLAKIDARILSYEAAERAILAGAQSYSIGQRTLTRANLTSVQRLLEELYTQKIKLERNGALRVQRVVPRDDV